MPQLTRHKALVAVETRLPDVGPAERLRRRYICNLRELYRRDPRLAARVDALPFALAPRLEPTRDGNLTASLAADDGKPITLHSRYRPLEEARRFVAAQRRTSAEPGEPDDLSVTAFLIGGIGLGYHLLEFEDQYDRPRMIVFEDDLGLLKAALCVCDLARPLREGRLQFLTAADKGLFHEVLRPVNTDLMLGLKYTVLPYASRYHAAFQNEARGLMNDYVAYARLQTVTLLRNSKITCKNIIYNLPAYFARPGVEVLHNKARGYPAILVAAGPSLARNIDQLGALRDRAVVIAVQTVFRNLLARGLPPHFVTSLDYHEISAQFFRDVDDVADTILVAEPKATWHVLDAFPGRTHVLHNDLYDSLLRSAAPSRGRIRPGSTVAHLSLYLAEYLGCDPIILLGQDLSFTEGFYYPAGMPIEQIWRPELGRYYTVEMKQWERIARFRPILRKVKDIHDREVYTDDQLFTYAEQFQSDFCASPARIIHACEGGMQLRGAEVMTLRAAAEAFCTRPLPANLFAAGSEPAAPEPRRAALSALQKQLDELRTVRKIAGEMRGLLDKLVNLLDRPSEFNRVVARVDELRSRIRDYETTYGMVVQVSQMAELRRYSADRRIGDRESEEEDAGTARRRLRRDREFVSEFIEGCEYLLETLPAGLRRLEESCA